jgi:hypothetical protein
VPDIAMPQVTAVLIRVMLRMLYYSGVVRLVLGNHRVMLRLDVRRLGGPVVAHRRRPLRVMRVTLGNIVRVTLGNIVRVTLGNVVLVTLGNVVLVTLGNIVRVTRRSAVIVTLRGMQRLVGPPVMLGGITVAVRAHALLGQAGRSRQQRRDGESGKNTHQSSPCQCLGKQG